MKELKTLIEALEKKGVINSLKRTVAAVPLPPGIESKEEAQQLINEAVRDCLCEYFMRNKEMSDLFIEFSATLGLNELVKTLDIKPSEKTTKDLPDFLHKIIDDLFKK